ncbi:phosphatase PAP2 family protein [Cohnella suwonensis]|uniref:Phosphatase PAP2 family protein n=1 Tax=Cohnella suwonensis TaxID=696072 RepID=A0ABW0LTT1_9BACL
MKSTYVMKSVFARSFALGIASLLVFALIASLVGWRRIAWFDDRVIAAVQGRESDAVTSVMKFFSFIGSTAPVVVLTAAAMLVLYVLLKHRGELLFFAGVVVGSALLNVVLKLAFRRDRPTLHRLAEEAGYSFPSGHSMAAFSLYGVLVFLLWKHADARWARLLLVALGLGITVMIGISRIYLGVHYPSDVIGGYMASCAWLALCIAFYRRRPRQ